MHRASRLTAQLAAADAAPAAPRAMKRAVIVEGARTPFVKAFGALRKVDSIGLGAAAVQGLLAKTKLDPNEVDQVIMGNVVVSSASPNLAREVIIDLNLPRTIPGTTVSVACLSGLEAVNQAVLLVEHGDARAVIAGGSDSMSNPDLPMPRRFTQALAKYQQGGGNKKGWAGLREMLSEAGSPSTWLPKPNAISERSTGKTMGYHADLMAEINGIERKDQDAFAMASHAKAARAQKDGRLREEIVPVSPGKGAAPVAVDDIVRGEQDAAKVAKLPPAFRPPPKGTVTAASSSPLTDGASAVLVMEEEHARALGFPADVFVLAYVKTAIDPNPQLLLAPAVGISRALDRAGLSLSDIDVFEIHEAFAAQVLSTIKVLASPDFARKALGKEQAVGLIPLDKVNPNGSSIAIGHPFAATGGRLVTAAIHELRRTRKRYALISICAAGGLGGVMILEHVPAART